MQNTNFIQQLLSFTSSYWFQFIMLILPATIIVGIAFTVVFGDEGLLAQKRIKEQLRYLNDETAKIESHNKSVSIQLTRLRKQPLQSVISASERMMAAPPKSVIYRFRE